MNTVRPATNNNKMTHIARCITFTDALHTVAATISHVSHVSLAFLDSLEPRLSLASRLSDFPSGQT